MPREVWLSIGFAAVAIVLTILAARRVVRGPQPTVTEQKRDAWRRYQRRMKEQR